MSRKSDNHFVGREEMLKMTQPAPQAYVYKSDRKLDTDPEFGGSFSEVRNWLLDHVLDPEYSTLRVHTGSKDDPDYRIAWSVKKFLDMTKSNDFVREVFLGKEEKVNHPSHYNKGKIEVIEAIEDWGLGFSLGNAVKYIARAEHKGNRIEDLEKAAWYIRREITRLQNERESKVALRTFETKPVDERTEKGVYVKTHLCFYQSDRCFGEHECLCGVKWGQYRD